MPRRERERENQKESEIDCLDLALSWPTGLHRHSLVTWFCTKVGGPSVKGLDIAIGKIVARQRWEKPHLSGFFHRLRSDRFLLLSLVNTGFAGWDTNRPLRAKCFLYDAFFCYLTADLGPKFGGQLRWIFSNVFNWCLAESVGWMFMSAVFF